jgi:hypothetical protein
LEGEKWLIDIGYYSSTDPCPPERDAAFISRPHPSETLTDQRPAVIGQCQFGFDPGVVHGSFPQPLSPISSSCTFGLSRRSTPQDVDGFSVSDPQPFTLPLSSPPTTISQSISPFTSVSPSPSHWAAHGNPQDEFSKDCGLCQVWFVDTKELMSHLAVKHSEQAGFCGRTGCRPVKDRRSLERHINTTPPHQSPFATPYQCCCGYRHGRKDKFKDHLDKYECSFNRPFFCSCNKFHTNHLGEFRDHFGMCGRGRKGRPPKRPRAGFGKD